MSARRPGAAGAQAPGAAAQGAAAAQAPKAAPVSRATPATATRATGSGATTAAARTGRRTAVRGANRATNTAPRSTPQMLRRLSAFGLLAGVLTGAASFGAVTIGENAARTSAATLATSAAATRAVTDIGTARAEASTAYLGGDGVSADDVQQGLGDAAVSLAGVRVDDATQRGEVEQAQRALTGYAAAAGTAVQAGAADTGAGQNLAVSDAALAQSAGVLQRLTLPSNAPNTTTTAGVATLLPILVGGGASALLVGTGVWLARRTHRVINPPLLVGTLLVVGSLAIGVAATALPAAAVSGQAAIGHLSPAASAAAAATQSRAAELAAVLPGADVAAATALAAAANTQVDATLTGSGELSTNSFTWNVYTNRQQRVLQVAATDRTQAVQAATTSSRNAYDAFIAALPPYDKAAQAPAAPPQGTPWAWLALLTGIAGGSAAWIGLDRRLKDYR